MTKANRDKQRAWQQYVTGLCFVALVMMIVLALIWTLLVGCSAEISTLDAGPTCSPISYQLCIIPDLPPPIGTWHCTDGPERGRAWCALCEPEQPLYCTIDADEAEQHIVCVPNCAICQPPGLPACRPENGTALGQEDLAWSGCPF